MKFCEQCHNAEVMPTILKNEPSVPAVMWKSPTNLSTFFYPTEEGKLCFYCKNFKKEEHIVHH